MARLLPSGAKARDRMVGGPAQQIQARGGLWVRSQNFSSPVSSFLFDATASRFPSGENAVPWTAPSASIARCGIHVSSGSGSSAAAAATGSSTEAIGGDVSPELAARRRHESIPAPLLA